MIIDVSPEEGRKLAEVQHRVTSRYMGKPKDLKIWGRMCDELKTGINEAGFLCSINTEVTPDGNWIPVVEINGRTDKHLEQIIQNEGIDLEQRKWESERVTSKELKEEGVDTDLLMG